MVESQVTSITAANHANAHRHGGDDPVTGDVRIGGIWIQDGAQIITAAPIPAVWTDVDISAVVGSNKVLVILKYECALTERFGVRPKGDTSNFIPTAGEPAGMTGAYLNGTASYLMVETDASGIYQHKGVNTNNNDAWVIAYMIY